MPHVREAASASHDRHDALLVAALAAGDLSGTDRDQALALTSSCTDCAALHADLVAIARATATLPPPITSPVRDYRLTPAQASSLRRTGWRRLIPSFGPVPMARPLGAALATFGIVGLLIGTQPLGFMAGMGSSAAAPAPANPAEITSGAGASANSDLLNPVAAASAAAASGAPEAGQPAASAAASLAPGPIYTVNGSPRPSPVPVADRGSAEPARAPVGGTTAGALPTAGPSAVAREGVSPEPNAETKDGSLGTEEPSSSTTPSPLVLVSLAAFLVGVVLFVTSYRSRRTSL